MTNISLIKQSKELALEMSKNGYPFCLSTQDWEGDYQRHCNTCVARYLNN